MGVVASVVAIFEAIEIGIDAAAAAATATASAASAASVAAVASGVISEAVATAISALIPGFDVLSSIAEIGVDAIEDTALDAATDAAVKTAGRKVAQSIVDKFARANEKVTYNNLIKVFKASYEKTEKTVKKVKYAQTAAVAAGKICCLSPSCVQDFKDTPKITPATLTCKSSTSTRRLSVDGVPGKWRSFDSVGANTRITYPLQLLCGESVKTVSSFEQAQQCYESTLRDLQLKVSMSSSWRNVAQYECKIILFGATDDPNDEYCTVFRVPSSSATDGMSNYTEVPHCVDVETATRSMLLASKVLPPGGLKPYIWAPSQTCELEFPGVRTSNIFPSIPSPTSNTNNVISLSLLIGVAVALVVVGTVTTFMHKKTHNLLVALRGTSPRAQNGESGPFLGM